MSLTRPPRSLIPSPRTLLGAGLAAALLVLPAAGITAPDDGLRTHRDALQTLRADAHADAVTVDLASYDAWLRAAATHAEYGQVDALQRIRVRLDAQKALIDARLELARTESRNDAARDRLRAIATKNKSARSEQALLERHLERNRKRGQ